ncbi:MAG: amphi-Trp domain-containing protein, partial [Alkalispirochaetaceae bacterium]
MKNVRLRSKEQQSRSEVAQALRKLADRLEENTVTLGQGNEQVTLTLPERVELKMKVTEKPKGQSTKQKLEVELSWTEGESASQ